VTTSLLLTNGYIHSVSEPYANALHADNGVIAWLGSDAAGQQLVAATVSGPIEARDLDQALVTPAFIDGFSTHPISATDTRVALSTREPTETGVYYAPVNEDRSDADGIYVSGEEVSQLKDILAEISPPTQLLIESADVQQLDDILAALEQQSNTSLMRSRHRILANHTITERLIDRLGSVHASVTVVPDIDADTPRIHAPVASLIANGIHVATGTGRWSGSIWDLVTALIEHEDEAQRLSTRAAFNTVSRDGVRVWPSQIAQEHMAAGRIAVGSPADVNIWRAEELGVQAPDIQAAHWSTDKRAGSALLPILSSSTQRPQLELRIRHGNIV